VDVPLSAILFDIGSEKMNKTWVYIGVWGFMVATTLLEIYTFTTSLSVMDKTVGIMALAFAQVIANATFFLNLGYEKKIVMVLPIIALIVLQTLLVTAIVSVGR
jgi:heme/copper-type cytochrome/quinol oxidase subunit 4